MPSLKAIRTRISSVKSTQKITRAMKLVSAARLRRAQDAIVGARPYANALADAIVEVALRAGADALPIDALGRYERDLYAFVDSRHAGLFKEIATKGTDKKAWGDLTAAMKTVLGEFGREFAPDTQAVA